jgi:hypothetical protein
MKAPRGLVKKRYPHEIRLPISSIYTGVIVLFAKGSESTRRSPFVLSDVFHHAVFKAIC